MLQCRRDLRPDVLLNDVQHMLSQIMHYLIVEAKVGNSCLCSECFLRRAVTLPGRRRTIGQHCAGSGASGFTQKGRLAKPAGHLQLTLDFMIAFSFFGVPRLMQLI